MSFSLKLRNVITRYPKLNVNLLESSYRNAFKLNYGVIGQVWRGDNYYNNYYSNEWSNPFLKYGLLCGVGIISSLFLNFLISNDNTKLICGGPSSLKEGEVRIGKKILPGSFVEENHYYEKVLNASLHPIVKSFLNLNHKRLVERYCHLHPKTDPVELSKLLKYKPKYLKWAGADLFVVSNERGQRLLCVIETNTCPSGQKSMPHKNEYEEQGGYLTLMSSTFKQLFTEIDPLLYNASLAVIYDKNDVESLGYACALANLTNETVYAVEYYNTDDNPPVKFENGICYIRVEKEININDTTLLDTIGITPSDDIDNNYNNNNNNEESETKIEYEWIPIRAAFRYVTQQPWNRIPINTKTKILNPIITCLAGGRNKNIASKAYSAMNTELLTTPGLQNLSINFPQTTMDVPKSGIEFCIKTLGGVGVIKVPYSNAGQGVWTITNEQELENFMNDPFSDVYDKFIVQSLIGNYTWSSMTSKGKLYHVGTIPNKEGKSYAADIRMMVHYNNSVGWSPLSVYSRRARYPLVKSLDKTKYDSWDILGTNLSVKLGDNTWKSDTHRLMLMDNRDFNKLGIGIDDLIQGFIQSILAVIAIDKMAAKLIDQDGELRSDIFEALNDDKVLIDEINQGNNYKN